ncbi:MAG: hypothetical protein OXE78_11220 [Gammaproteobacteria bacterium]|nr:hypothetical protein [Gammaproteobacteria bacterium]MCY4356919.1 hypothetical protein [Gammaproteobacteria bacterium]
MMDLAVYEETLHVANSSTSLSTVGNRSHKIAVRRLHSTGTNDIIVEVIEELKPDENLTE